MTKDARSASNTSSDIPDKVCDSNRKNSDFDPFFGFFDEWSTLERNFFFLLLIVLCYQLHIFSFIHVGFRTPKASDIMSFDHSYAPGIDADSVDTAGRNWVPVFDRETQICLNIDSLVKQKGDAIPSERNLWKDFHCPDRLKGLYQTW
jgi:hypothetical protein